MTTPPERLTRRRRQVLRLRQALAAALILAALAVAGVFLLRRHRQTAELARAAPAKAPLVGLTIRQSAAGVTIAKSVAGKPVFRLTARRADTLRANGHDLLYDVHVLVYDNDGVHADSIAGSEFGYDSRSGALQARGAVRMTLASRPGEGRARPSPPVRLVAHDLSYNIKQGTGTIAHGVTFAMGSAEGAAASARLDSHAGTAEFSGGVSLQWRRIGRPPVTVAAQDAILHRLPRAAAPDAASVDLLGRARLISGPQSLTADQLTLWLRRDHSLRRMVAAGHIQAADALPGRRLTLRAATAQAGFARGPRRPLDRLVLAGGVDARQITPGQRGRLRAGHVVFVYTAAGVLQQVRASESAVLQMRGTQRQTLSAPELDFTLRPIRAGAAPSQLRLAAITNQGRATLVSGTDTAMADRLRLTLNAKEQPTSALASGDVQLSQAMAGANRSSRSDRLALRFAAISGKPQLLSAVATGHVVVSQGGRQIAADNMTYTPAGGRAEFRGHILARSAQARFSAQRLVWISSPSGGGELHARGGVALSFTGGAATLGVGPAEANASRLPVVVTADTLDWRDPAPAHATGAGSGLRLDAASAAGFHGTATFRGGVRLLQSPNLLRADAVRLEGERALIATGHVTTTMLAPGAKPKPVVISAARLSYSAGSREAKYDGAAAMQVENAWLRAPHITAWLRRAGGLQRAQAFRGVRVTQPGRIATAQTVTYDFASGQVELTGGPPSILDAEQGKIGGDPLTFSLSNDEIQVGSKSGGRATGQLIAHK